MQNLKWPSNGDLFPSCAALETESAAVLWGVSYALRDSELHKNFCSWIDKWIPNFWLQFFPLKMYNLAIKMFNLQGLLSEPTKDALPFETFISWWWCPKNIHGPNTESQTRGINRGKSLSNKNKLQSKNVKQKFSKKNYICLFCNIYTLELLKT